VIRKDAVCEKVSKDFPAPICRHVSASCLRWVDRQLETKYNDSDMMFHLYDRFIRQLRCMRRSSFSPEARQRFHHDALDIRWCADSMRITAYFTSESRYFNVKQTDTFIMKLDRPVRIVTSSCDQLGTIPKTGYDTKNRCYISKLTASTASKRQLLKCAILDPLARDR
jgi:hypothetical protein